MSILEINCPSTSEGISVVRLNGIDVGDIRGITRIVFVVAPGMRPSLTVERETIDPDTPRRTVYELVADLKDALERNVGGLRTVIGEA